MMRLVTYKELYLLYGIRFTRQHVLRLQKAGLFPLRRKVGNLNHWLAEEIEAWIAGLRRPTTAPERE